MASVLQKLCLIIAITTCSNAFAADTFRDFNAAYHCEVAERLERIHAAGNPDINRDRFIAITLMTRRHVYVQCIFQDATTKLYCEASSGFFMTKAGEKRRFYATSATKKALARLGFDTDDSAGNFKIERDVGSAPDFDVLADFMLRALYDGYDARATEKIEFTAPFARRKPTNCIPAS